MRLVHGSRTFSVPPIRPLVAGAHQPTERISVTGGTVVARETAGYNGEPRHDASPQSIVARCPPSDPAWLPVQDGVSPLGIVQQRELPKQADGVKGLIQREEAGTRVCVEHIGGEEALEVSAPHHSSGRPGTPSVVSSAASPAAGKS